MPTVEERVLELEQRVDRIEAQATVLPPITPAPEVTPNNPEGVIHVELIKTVDGWMGKFTDNGWVTLEGVTLRDAAGTVYTPDAQYIVRNEAEVVTADTEFTILRNGNPLPGGTFILPGAEDFTSHVVRIKQ